jgi:hypothetical protein
MEVMENYLVLSAYSSGASKISIYYGYFAAKTKKPQIDKSFFKGAIFSSFKNHFTSISVSINKL